MRRVDGGGVGWGEKLGSEPNRAEGNGSRGGSRSPGGEDLMGGSGWTRRTTCARALAAWRGSGGASGVRPDGAMTAATEKGWRVAAETGKERKGGA